MGIVLEAAKKAVEIAIEENEETNHKLGKIFAKHLYDEKYPPRGLVEEGNADIMNTNAPDPMQPDQGLVTPKSTKIRQTK